MNQQKNIRIASIDILRALTMLLMIFVNDLWSLKDIPGWLEHTAAADDGMGLADTVFPAFLFITGMSIPLAVNYRRSKGDNNGQILMHILLRSVALLIMGVFLVNGEYINEAATGMKRSAWNTICCLCFITIWNSWPEKMNKTLQNLFKIAALVVLLFLAWIYRGGENAEQPGYFAAHWWGILGLIGWAYLVSAATFAFSGNRITILLMAWLLFNFLCIASHAGWLHSVPFLKMILSPLGGGSMPALVSGGVLTTVIFLKFQGKGQNTQLIGILFICSIFLLAAGFYLRSFWGISKIRATPAWVLICSAITIIMFIIVYWIADLRSGASLFSVIKPAGNNTLLCYLLPYFAYAIVALSHLHLPDMVLTGGIGLLKSALFSLLIVVITGLLGRRGIRLKL